MFPQIQQLLQQLQQLLQQPQLLPQQHQLQVVYFGKDTRIYRLNTNGDSTPQEWYGQNGGNISQSSSWYVASDDGDVSYIFSSTSGTRSVFNFSDIPGDAPQNIGGIKLYNIARKSSISSASFNNVLSSGNNTPVIDLNGSGYNVTSDQYSSKSRFLLSNPFTGSGWTKQEINDLQLGVKYIG